MLNLNFSEVKILFWKNKIKGLTTAASLWTVAAVGLAVGGNLYFAAIATTILILVVLAAVQPIEKRFFKRPKIMEINLRSRSNIK